MTSEQYSDIQRKIFDFIVNYIKDEGMPPTNRDIGKAMKIASTGHVDYHLSMLEGKGLITREAKKSRGIKLAHQPWGIPVNGQIAAGEPLDVYIYPSEILEVGRDLEQQGAYALVVKGNSMILDNIGDGDYVVIKPQATCENGDIIVAVHLAPGTSGEATLKRFFYDKEYVRLQPANSEMDPIIIPKFEWYHEWQIQGKVLAIFHKSNPRSDALSLILEAKPIYTEMSGNANNEASETRQVISPRRLRVFLCHSSGDKPSVRQLYQRLKACNVDPWLDEEDLLPGQDWEHEIRKAVRASDVVIVCLSPGSISKTGFVQKEIKFALDVAAEQPEGTIFLIPLKLEECNIPEHLSRWQWVKYYEETGFDKLIRSLKSRSETVREKLAPVNLPKEI